MIMYVDPKSIWFCISSFWLNKLNEIIFKTIVDVSYASTACQNNPCHSQNVTSNICEDLTQIGKNSLQVYETAHALLC